MVKIREKPTKMDDLGVPLFLETPIFIKHSYNIYIYTHYQSRQISLNDIWKIQVDYNPYHPCMVYFPTFG